MSQLIGMLDAARVSANLVREYALDHYVHFGFLPNDVDVDGHVFDYETYNYLIDLFHPDFHKIAVKKRVAKLRDCLLYTSPSPRDNR